MKLTKEDRQQLDRDVLASISDYSGHATYVYRNRLDWPGDRWHRKGLETSDVLRSCRRLERDGLLDESHSHGYAVMKSWVITPTGLVAALQHKEAGEC